MWRWRGLLRQAVDRPQIAGLVAHIGRIEPMTLSAVILGAVLLLVFASLANAVAHGNTHAFDEWLIIALRTPGDLADPLGPKWLEEMTRDFTALGSTGVLALMVLAIAGFLAMTYKRHGALLVLVSVAGGVFISQTMKWAYARARPTWCRMGRKSSALGEWLKYSLDTSSGRSEKSKLSSAIRRSRDQSIIRSSTAVDCSPPVWARSRAVRRALN